MSEEQLEKRINQAVLDFTLGEEDKAEHALIGILEESPGNSNALRALAEVRLAKGIWMVRKVRAVLHWNIIQMI